MIERSRTNLGTASDWRTFGLGLAVLLVVFALFGLWRADFALTPLRIVLLALAACGAGLAFLAPRLLRWPYRGFQAFGRVMGAITTRLVLAVVFFVVLTPMALVQRLLRRDPLGLRARNAQTPSFWRAPEPDPRGRERYTHPF